ncbi:MAG: transcriptional repressor LexA [Deltaproteobacteria bacterium]|nr:transcriptional repressor LexA [Deltaproteobacteria bacterium]
MAEALTKRQNEIWNFISIFCTEQGYPPTLREIGEHFGIKSTNGVNDHLKALEKKGYLRREDLKSRALRPVTPGGKGIGNVIPLAEPANGEQIDIPIVGQVAAGAPLLAVENVEDTVRVDRFFVGNHQSVFGLRIVGESMIDDGIHNGDYVFVKKTSSANKGDIVVAMIEGEATVKRYYPEGDRIRFQPANETMEPIYVHKSEFKSVDIIGIVVGVYRRVI